MPVKNISGLTREERIHRIVLSAALKQSVVAQYQSTIGGLTDEEIYEIISKIEHRIHYITEAPSFEFIDNGKTKQVSCMTMLFKLDDFLNVSKDKYFIFYNIWGQENVSLNLTTSKSIMIRGSFQDDPAAIRDIKINNILGEED
jgi:hypothetical protein